MRMKMKPTELIGHRLKLQHLNVAIAVAKLGSMGKAAKHLAISQPVVSKVIADLEDMLEVRLFDRSPSAEREPRNPALSRAGKCPACALLRGDQDRGPTRYPVARTGTRACAGLIRPLSCNQGAVVDDYGGAR